MAAQAQNPSVRSKLGGNNLLFKQIQRNPTTGVLEPFSGTTDALGEAAGTWHVAGTHESTDIPRDSTGKHKIDIVLFEWDLARKNFAILCAPYSTTAATKKEQLEVEDGTVLESSDGASEDASLPIFAVIVRDEPLGGNENAFYCTAQMARDMAYGGSKSGVTKKPKFSFNTIDAGGYVCLNPTTGHAWVTGLTPPTLAGANAMGIWVEAA